VLLDKSKYTCKCTQTYVCMCTSVCIFIRMSVCERVLLDQST